MAGEREREKIQEKLEGGGSCFLSSPSKKSKIWLSYLPLCFFLISFHSKAPATLTSNATLPATVVSFFHFKQGYSFIWSHYTVYVVMYTLFHFAQLVSSNQSRSNRVIFSNWNPQCGGLLSFFLVRLMCAFYGTPSRNKRKWRQGELFLWKYTMGSRVVTWRRNDIYFMWWCSSYSGLLRRLGQKESSQWVCDSTSVRTRS